MSKIRLPKMRTSIDNAAIDKMLSRGGMYVVTMFGGVAFVEVTADGICHQLEIRSGSYDHDGILSRDGWNLASIVSIDGPFARIKTEEST